LESKFGIWTIFTLLRILIYSLCCDVSCYVSMILYFIIFWVLSSGFWSGLTYIVVIYGVKYKVWENNQQYFYFVIGQGVEIIFLFVLMILIAIIISIFCVISNIYLKITKRNAFNVLNYPFYSNCCCIPFEFIYHWIYRNCCLPLCLFYSRVDNISLFGSNDCYLSDSCCFSEPNRSVKCPNACCILFPVLFCCAQVALLHESICLKLEESKARSKYYLIFVSAYIFGILAFICLIPFLIVFLILFSLFIVFMVIYLTFFAIISILIKRWNYYSKYDNAYIDQVNE